MPYRVDNIPLRLKPFYLAYSYAMGWFLYGLAWCLHETSRINFEGHENLEGSPNHIFAAWHTHLGPYFPVFIKHEKPHAWINHPLWYMKPIHILLQKIGIRKIILGSAGHGGKDAADQLVAFLREGYSTLINPDGPAGPPRVLKKGVLHVALNSGIPVIPMKIEAHPCVVFKTWDSKRLVLPFSKITVVYGKAVRVTRENFDLVGQEISQGMT